MADNEQKADLDLDLDSLADKILGRLRRAKPPENDDDYEEEPVRGRDAQARIRQLVSERRALQNELGEIKAQVEQLQSAHQTALDDLRSHAAEQVTQIRQRHDEDLSLVDLGVTDPLGRDAIRGAWQAAPKDAKGKGPVDWWQSLTEAHKAHAQAPDEAQAPSVPRLLTPYLPEIQAADTTQGNAGASGASGAAQGAATATFRTPTSPNRAAARGIESVPLDQGIDAFLSGLRNLTPGA